MFKNLTRRGAFANDRILYDNATGVLFYDSEGSGANAAAQFASLFGSPTVTAADFFMV